MHHQNKDVLYVTTAHHHIHREGSRRSTQAARAGIPVTAYLEQTIRRDALRASIRPPETQISYKTDDPSQIVLKFDRANNRRPMPLIIMTHTEAEQLARTLQLPPEQVPGCPSVSLGNGRELIEVSKRSRAVVFDYYTAEGSAYMRTMSHSTAHDVGVWLLAAVRTAQEAMRISTAMKP